MERLCCRFCCHTRLLLAAVAALLLTSSAPRLISASPQRPGAAGVFMFIENKRYTLNFTAATMACQLLNVTMATRAQVERALQEGLETCKFGWIHEQIAVIPRITSDDKCGKGNTGLVTWAAKLETKFAVYCYDASVIQESSTARPLASTSPAVPMTPTPSLVPTTPPEARTTPPKDRSTLTHFVEMFTRAVRTTRPSRTSQTSASESVSTLRPTPPPHPLATTPVTAAVFSTSLRTTEVLVTSERMTLATVSPPRTTLGAGRVVLVLGVIALLVMAAGAVRCYKLDVLPWCSRGRQKDDTETEMWKHADSEADLRERRGEDGDEEEDEEETQRKYSSDVTLCVGPGIKAGASE